jgi:hypothetical protein
MKTVIYNPAIQLLLVDAFVGLLLTALAMKGITP